MEEKKNNIILIGMPGAGKSTIGVLLAKSVGADFVDTDLLIQKREGLLLQQILDKRGLEYFLETEADTVCAIECENCVIAPGGSAVCVSRAACHLKALGTVVYLKLPFEEIVERINNIKSRGIAVGPGQTLRDVYEQRVPMYEAYAEITIEADIKSAEQIVQEIVRKIRA